MFVASIPIASRSLKPHIHGAKPLLPGYFYQACKRTGREAVLIAAPMIAAERKMRSPSSALPEEARTCWNTYADWS